MQERFELPRPPEVHEHEPRHARVASLELLGARKEQQDAHAWAESEWPNGKRFLFAVADGHGVRGEKVSRYAVERVTHDLAAEEKLDAPTIRERFAELQAAIVNDHHANGTTLTVVVREGDALTTAYVGDSEVWLFKNGKLARRTVPHRFKDHKHEKERLERSPARIEGGRIVVASHQPWATEADTRDIDVTRGLGGEEFEPYLSHEPQIETIHLDGSEKFLLIGTDGFWNAATLKSKSHHAIEHVLASSKTAEEVRGKIADILKRREIHDNATLLITEL